MNRDPFPRRIVALSAESADILARCGAWNRVAGVTAFFEIPEGMAHPPRVSGFSTASIDKIIALQPDLVITYSDVQAKIAAELISAGLPVLATNQHTLAETEDTIRLIGRVAGCEKAADALADAFKDALSPRSGGARRPRVYFEEWDEPLIHGITWVSELIERAGGADVLAERRGRRRSMDRAVSPDEVAALDPEIIFVSWCGKKADLESVAGRPGWANLSAVRHGRLFEIASAHILQPGPALLDGYRELTKKINDCRPDPADPP